MGIRIIDIAFQSLDALDEDRLQRSRESFGTLVVSTETNASAVALIAESQEAGLIIVTDEADIVRGIVLPNWIAHQVGEMKREPVETFGEAVRVLEDDPQTALIGARHEWLNFDRPELYWCEAGHYTDHCPCKNGHLAPCGPSR